MTVSLTSGYHPQANGQVELVNQEVGRFLKTFCSDHQGDWVRFLPWAKHVQNSLRHSAMGLTPFQCVLGYQPPFYPWNAITVNAPAVDDCSDAVRRWAHHCLEQMAATAKRFLDKRRATKPQFWSGDRVWLATKKHMAAESYPSSTSGIWKVCIR